MAKNNSIPTGILKRSGQLLTLAAKLGATEILGQVKSRLGDPQLDQKIEQARFIAEHLSQLKGAAMKAGQLLSIDAAEYLPPEAVELLQQLQSQAPPVPFNVLREVLERDLDPSRLAEIEFIDESPIAAASIGQVHRGRVKDEEVVFKIQYPGIADSIDSDLGMLSFFLSSLSRIGGKQIDFSQFFSELRFVLNQEANYDAEKKYLTEFQELAGQKNFVVPKVLTPFCSKHILTTSYERGVELSTWLKAKPDLERRIHIAKSFLELFLFEFYEIGLVQTDPNPANFLIRKDKATQKDQLVLLDFGATLRYSHDFRCKYRELILIFKNGNSSQIIEAAIAFGLLDQRENAETRSLFVELLKSSLEPFQNHVQPFNFSNIDYARKTRDSGWKFIKSLQFSPPPHQLIFLHRKLGGIYNILKLLDVQLNLLPYWAPEVGPKTDDNIYSSEDHQRTKV